MVWEFCFRDSGYPRNESFRCAFDYGRPLFIPLSIDYMKCDTFEKIYKIKFFTPPYYHFPIAADNTLMGTQDMDVDKCRKTDIVINTYDELLKTINFVDQRNQRQKQKYEDFIKDYVERIGKVGEELYANCKCNFSKLSFRV